MSKTSLVGLLASCLMMALAAGCDGSVATGTGGGGSGGSGGSGGGGASCTGFADETGAGVVTFHLRNETLEPIYILGNCGTSPQYSLSQVGAGEDATSWGDPDPSCLMTCEDLQTEGQVACDACAPSVLRIDAGKSLDVVWHGTGLRSGYMMPAACYASPGQDSCSRIVAAPAGTWAVTATAFSECSGENCMCQPDGTCWGIPSGFQASADTATFSFPSETSVDVVFSACAFGCP